MTIIDQLREKLDLAKIDYEFVDGRIEMTLGNRLKKNKEGVVCEALTEILTADSKVSFSEITGGVFSYRLLYRLASDMDVSKLDSSAMAELFAPVPGRFLEIVNGKLVANYSVNGIFLVGDFDKNFDLILSDSCCDLCMIKYPWIHSSGAIVITL